MRHYISKFAQLLILSVLALPAMAHEGHDHSHWTSGLLHVLFYGSIIAAALGLSFALYKNSDKHSQKNSGGQ